MKRRQDNEIGWDQRVAIAAYCEFSNIELFPKKKRITEQWFVNMKDSKTVHNKKKDCT